MGNYQRELPWTMGTNLEGVKNSAEALEKAGLDWEVIQQPMYFQTPDKKFRKVKDRFINARSFDLKYLGDVGKNYKVLQNREAFEFADELLGEGVKYIAAGAFNRDRRVWLLAKLPEEYRVLNNDLIVPYFCLSNSFDGDTGICGFTTPIRFQCSNALTLALKKSHRRWRIYHSKSAMKKIEEARITLDITRSYYKNLEETANKLGQIKLSYDQMVEELFPIAADASTVRVQSLTQKREDLYELLERPDLRPYKNTGWAFVNAVSDMVTHADPGRKVVDVDTWKANQMGKVMGGYELLNKAFSLVTKTV